MEGNAEDEIEKLALEELMKEAKSGAERAREYGALAWDKNTVVPPTNKVFLKNMLLGTLEKSKSKPTERTDYKRRRFYRSRSHSRKRSHSHSRRSHSHSKARRSGSNSRRSRWSDSHSRTRRSQSNSKHRRSASNSNERKSRFSRSRSATKKSPSSLELKRKRSHSNSKNSKTSQSPGRRWSRSQSPLKPASSDQHIESKQSSDKARKSKSRSHSKSKLSTAHPDKENLHSHINRSRSRSQTKKSKRSSQSRKSHLKTWRTRSYSRNRRSTFYSRSRRSRSNSYSRRQNRPYFRNYRISQIGSKDRYNALYETIRNRKRKLSEDSNAHHKSKKKSKKHKKKKKKSKSDKKNKEKVKKSSENNDETQTEIKSDEMKVDTSEVVAQTATKLNNYNIEEVVNTTVVNESLDSSSTRTLESLQTEHKISTHCSAGDKDESQNIHASSDVNKSSDLTRVVVIDDKAKHEVGILPENVSTDKMAVNEVGTVSENPVLAENMSASELDISSSKTVLAKKPMSGSSSNVSDSVGGLNNLDASNARLEHEPNSSSAICMETPKKTDILNSESKIQPSNNNNKISVPNKQDSKDSSFNSTPVTTADSMAQIDRGDRDRVKEEQGTEHKDVGVAENCNVPPVQDNVLPGTEKTSDQDDRSNGRHSHKKKKKKHKKHKHKNKKSH